MAKRWDGDTRGRGIADGGRLVSGASELVDAFGQPSWVAEEPEVHLLPHFRACGERDERLVLRNAHRDESEAYVLDLEWHGSRRDTRGVRAAVFALIGQVAESATYVRQRRIKPPKDDEVADLLFEVGTGELAADTKFVPHGHVLLVNVHGVF